MAVAKTRKRTVGRPKSAPPDRVYIQIAANNAAERDAWREHALRQQIDVDGKRRNVTDLGSYMAYLIRRDMAESGDS